MKNYLLNRLRINIKSIGKTENNIIDKIILNNSEASNKNKLEDKHFKNVLLKRYRPNKIAIVICFHFKKKRLETLKLNISNISKYNFQKDVTIITNDITKTDQEKISRIIKDKIKNYSIITIKNLPDDNFLPWHSINVMREKIKSRSFSHFMFLEDDIIVNSENISYWMHFRKILKKFSLIPNFLRCELYNRKYYSVDNPNYISKNKMPTISTKTKKFGFINSKYPYSGMYLMDRNLLKVFLKSEASKIDFGFTHKVMRALYPIKELANIAHAYFLVPNGYHNKLVLPFDGNKIPSYCVIEHKDLKYSKHQSLNITGHGTIDIKYLLK